MYYAHKDAPETRREKITSCITMIVVVVLILLCGGFFVLSHPVLWRPKGKARRTACGSNLKQIGIALEGYQADYRGYCPPSLVHLFTAGYVGGHKVFYCPCCKGSKEVCESAEIAFEMAKFRCSNPNWRDQKTTIDISMPTPPLDYIYVRYKTREDAADAPIVYDKAENHEKESRYVLFGDGHVEWISENELPKRFAEESERVPAFKVYLDRYGIDGDGAN